MLAISDCRMNLQVSFVQEAVKSCQKSPEQSVVIQTTTSNKAPGTPVNWAVGTY